MTPTMPRPRPRFLHRETTRHGKTVWYVRRGSGPRIRLHSPYGSASFEREYEDALSGRAAPRPDGQMVRGSVAWLVNEYINSAAWKELAAPTRAQRHGLLKDMASAIGHEPARAVGPKSIDAGIDRRRDKPHSANNWLKTMRGLFRWALKHDHIVADPTRNAKMLAGANDRTGYHTWTEEEVARFEARWPVGSRERLALHLFLYTGLRRGDVARLGPAHIRHGKIRIVTEKTQQEVTIRVLPALADALRVSPTGPLTFVATIGGRPMTKESFGNWFRDACVDARVPGRAHGLRKAGARKAAESGATEAELNAWFGWADGSRESATYVRGANRAKIADRLADRLSERDPIPAPKSGAGVRDEKDCDINNVKGTKSDVAPRADLQQPDTDQ